MCITCVTHTYDYVLLVSHDADHEHITYNHKSHNICHDAHNYRVPTVYLPCRFFDFLMKNKKRKIGYLIAFLTTFSATTITI